jgi:hypothetical protein
LPERPVGTRGALVGAEGIEPPLLPCLGNALPMSYAPSVSPNSHGGVDRGTSNLTDP